MLQDELKTEDQEEIAVRCVNCGKELTEETGVLASPDWYEDTRYVHYCRECQQKQFEDFAENTSAAFAYFMCCAAYNKPFIPECMPSGAYAVDEITWIMYLQNLENSDYNTRDDNEPAAFVDGMTDIGALFGGKITAQTKFATGITMEGSAAKVPGTKAQRRKWGTIDHYTTEDYKELDRLYSIESEDRLENGITSQEEYILREICKLKLSYTKSRAKGDIQEAKSTYSIISKMMEDNLMRKRDEAPVNAAFQSHLDKTLVTDDKGRFLFGNVDLTPILVLFRSSVWVIGHNRFPIRTLHTALKWDKIKLPQLRGGEKTKAFAKQSTRQNSSGVAVLQIRIYRHGGSNIGNKSVHPLFVTEGVADQVFVTISGDCHTEFLLLTNWLLRLLNSGLCFRVVHIYHSNLSFKGFLLF